MNFLLLKEKEQLLQERSELVKKKSEITAEITDLKIAAGVASKYNSGLLKPHIIASIGEHKFVLRSQLTREIIRIEKEISIKNTRITEINLLEEQEKSTGQILKDILREILSTDQFELIMKELNNRELGIAPTKVNLGLDNSVNQKQLADKSRKLAKEAIDMLITCRKNLTSVIDAGTAKFDKGYFLQVISPLNRTLPTIIDLDKMKRNNHLN